MKKVLWNKIKEYVLRVALMLLPVLAYAIESFVVGTVDKCLSKI